MSKKDTLFFVELKRIRKEKKLTQGEMARKLGISDTAYQNYENVAMPPHEQLIKINEILGTDLSRFIYQKELGKRDGDLLRELQHLVAKYSNSDDPQRNNQKAQKETQDQRKRKFPEDRARPSGGKLKVPDLPAHEQGKSSAEGKSGKGSDR